MNYQGTKIVLTIGLVLCKLQGMKRKAVNKKSAEEMVSMFLGLVIVMVVFGLVVNFFQKRKGSVSVPGAETAMETENENEMMAGGDVYVVEAGDSLWKIAEKHYNSGYKWVEIVEENNLENPGMLAVGQELSLPELTVEVVQTETIEGDSYMVVKGDNLWEIAVKAYGDGYSWTKIWEANRNVLNSPGLLEIGMSLELPRE
jgi:nucleoid-associated protein YgaU